MTAPLPGQMSRTRQRLADYPDPATCPVRNVLDQIAGKWSVLILGALSDRPYRFGELRREIGDISQRMLTQTLRELQADGLIEREVFPTTPPSVEYRLSPLGQGLCVALAPVIDWSIANYDRVVTARAAFAEAA